MTKAYILPLLRRVTVSVVLVFNSFHTWMFSSFLRALNLSKTCKRQIVKKLIELFAWCPCSLKLDFCLHNAPKHYALANKRQIVKEAIERFTWSQGLVPTLAPPYTQQLCTREFVLTGKQIILAHNFRLFATNYKAPSIIKRPKFSNAANFPTYISNTCRFDFTSGPLYVQETVIFCLKYTRKTHLRHGPLWLNSTWPWLAHFIQFNKQRLG